jgi:hypothetical protein
VGEIWKMHVVYANLISDGNPIDVLYQYINPWCEGKGWTPVALCVHVIVLFMSVYCLLFFWLDQQDIWQMQLIHSAFTLLSCLDNYLWSVFWEAQKRKIRDLEYLETSRGAEESHKTTVKLADITVVYKKIVVGVFHSLKPKYHMLKLHQVGFGRIIARGVGRISGGLF